MPDEESNIYGGDVEVMTREEVEAANTAPPSTLDQSLVTSQEDLDALGHGVPENAEPTVPAMPLTGPHSGQIVKNQSIPNAELPPTWRDPLISTPGLPTDEAVESVGKYGSVTAGPVETEATARGELTAGDPDEPYESWTNGQLQAELDSRGVEYRKSAPKAELVAALEEDDG